LAGTSGSPITVVVNGTAGLKPSEVGMSTRAALAFLLVLMAVGAARGQAPSGTIAGIATDSSDAAVPGVR